MPVLRRLAVTAATAVAVSVLPAAAQATPARNLGTVPVELYVTYLNPAGNPLSVDAADPGCTPAS
ncbi:MAG: hypothetical protein LC713_01360 [Actinobacteria bacterium]|nr:hypothetical protein [Actinomycetota bacterium]